MIRFTENTIIQTINGQEKTWTVAELLETYDPLPGEPLAVRNEAMKQLLPMAADVYSELSEKAILRYDFWKQLLPQRIQEQRYEYSVKISKTYHWELSVTPEGLFYKDISPLFGQIPGKVHEQLFSDFWFYGPLMPLPDMDTRKWVVANIRNAFLQVGPVSRQHFRLFDYPDLDINPMWEEGDHNSKDYVIMRPFGIEIGCTNWHDGLVYSGFISFERFLVGPVEEHHISPKVREEMLEHLAIKDTKPLREEPDPKKAVWKQMYMENGGMHHYIYRENGNDYSSNPIDEFIWRRELIDDLTQRLKIIDHYSGFHYIATTLRYHGVPDVAELLASAAKGRDLKAQQDIERVLGELFNSEKM